MHLLPGHEIYQGLHQSWAAVPKQQDHEASSLDIPVNAAVLMHILQPPAALAS